MFQRRKKPGLLLRLRTWVWPTGGWVRATTYVMHRLARMPGSSYSIAAGFACGAAVSFTPFVGTHFLWAGLIAWIVRGNIIVALIGTVIGNPWTFPFIWIWLYKSGNWLLRGSGHASGNNPDFHSTFSQMTDAFLHFNVGAFIDSASPVVWPMFISSIPTAFVVWFLFYIPIKKAIDGYQHRRRRQPVKDTGADGKPSESYGDNG